MNITFGPRIERTNTVSTEAKRSYSSTLALLLFGVLAFFAGPRWLVVFIPAAVLVWYAAAGSTFRKSRN